MSQDFAQSVKAQADIVRIIGDYVKLRKSGAQNFSGLCPFHNEKSPSFSVHATKQFFHCFGCGVSGDVFSFVQKIENSSFPEAVRAVATKVGIALPKQQYTPEEAREASLRGKLLDLHESACEFFTAQLARPQAAAAREYLQSRAFSEEMVKEHRLGFAPDSGFALRDKLKNEFDEATLKASGIFSWKDEAGGVGVLYSKFRNRIIFPIRNEQGKVIAFNGRILDAGGGGDKEKLGPKYLNSPETPIYHKGSVLYNLDKAKEAIRRLDYSIVVEGNVDAIRVYSSGLHNVIASSGTAFTETQIRLLGRFSKNIIVNFDPDTAGAAATERSLAMLVEEDFNIRVITLEPGLDPDLYIRNQGIKAYEGLVRNARKYFHFLIDRAQQQFPPASPEAKVKALNYLLPHIQRVPSRIARDEIAADVAQRLGIDSAVLRQELKSAASSRGTREIKPPAVAAFSPAEKVLIHSLLGSGAVSEMARETLLAENLHQGWASQETLQAILDASPEALAEPLALPLSEAARNHLAAALMETDAAPEEDAVREALSAMRRPHLERELRELQSRIDQAGRRQDAGAIATLTQQKLALKRALDGSKRAER